MGRLSVSDGVLRITTFTDDASVHHIGHINTEDHFQARNGYYEARARFGDSFGQVLVLPVGGQDGQGRASERDPVEADIYEHRELDGGGWDKHDYVQGRHQLGLRRGRLEEVQPDRTHPDGEPLKGAWHNHSLLWTPEGYTSYIDEQQVFRTSAAVSNVPQNVLLTCEVLDGSWAGNIPERGYGSLETTTLTREVDWVRVWAPEDPALR